MSATGSVAVVTTTKAVDFVVMTSFTARILNMIMLVNILQILSSKVGD